ncbi:RecB family nuclease, putative, TM0106 family [Rhodococcus tukisamuensis]|uniref:RecB family nuclease, putative, TM0106 family n=1 Tax=Rhodococcus tukisamuensis TaxID=168276 RepID=A0A1G6M1W6_9NOCA|nr:RecB family nuclease, putative, TM0106 family [Rhodococcus tukisamuensis]
MRRTIISFIVISSQDPQDQPQAAVAELPPPTQGQSPPVLIDPRALTSCRHRVHLDAAHPAAVASVPEDVGVQQRREAARAHREAMRQRLMDADGLRWVVVDPAAPARERAAATLAACADGADRIWGAVLPLEFDTGRRGRAELLVRDAERGGYFPVIVVNHKVTDPGSGAVTSGLDAWEPAVDETRKVRAQLRDQFRLAQLYRMLERRGHASPAMLGGAIGYGGECILVHDLAAVMDQYDERFADRIAVARGELATVPSQIGECRSCPWWDACKAELTQARDVSLVASGSRADVLRAAGVDTIDALAAWDGPAPEDWQGNGFADSVVIARAWLAGVPLARRHETVTVQRADVEVDVDMESYQEHGAYLWGTLLTEGGVTEPYRPFVTWDPLPTRDEARSFAEFWNWLTGTLEATLAQGKTFAAYCYSRAAEDKWLLDSATRFAGMPGIPTVKQVRTFIDGPHWVDIYQAVGEQFVCPNGKGLKKIAPVAGFNWRDAEAGGEASMSWYREAVGYDGQPNLDQRERLFVYNEDDVRATKVLREWMTERAEAEIPLASEL